jgi:16S rRNA C967 or C1407 C5-methylase (RsmB/RsmF family)
LHANKITHAAAHGHHVCAGGGVKTLALAASMRNTGQIYAYDADAL